jgi:hypothetical protein
MLFVIVDQTAEAANEDWVFPGRKRSDVARFKERGTRERLRQAFVASKECDEELSKGLEAKIYRSCRLAIGFKRAGCQTRGLWL